MWWFEGRETQEDRREEIFLRPRERGRDLLEGIKMMEGWSRPSVTRLGESIGEHRSVKVQIITERSLRILFSLGLTLVK